MKKRKIKRIKWKNILLMLAMIVSLITFLVSAYKIISRLNEKWKTDKLIDNINSLVVIEENNNLEKEEIINEEIENDSNQDDLDITSDINYYYEYLKVPFMSVEFSALKKINPDVVGWLNVTSAGINYPYVQTSDNDYYLTHSFDKSVKASGWVFLDYRNDVDNQDQNTIIYAHGGNAIAMFGPLKKMYDKTDWYNNFDNHYIKVSTDNYNFVYKVFSLYVIETTSDYLKINFASSDDYLSFLEKIKNRSYYEFETEVEETDKIITLSTCYNKKEKLVLHGKLIKQEKR